MAWNSGGARVHVASSQLGDGKDLQRMSFLQAQEACFKDEEDGGEENRIARKLKEENDSRVDALLDAELKRRHSKQDETESAGSKQVDQRRDALQKLRSMEWKRNQQDHLKITREQVVRYEEVRAQRDAEEVFFEGTRQGKKTRRKSRKEEVIHSFNEMPKSVPQQERKAECPAVSKKLPQPPLPPRSNAWLHKRGSELFGSVDVAPGSAEEEDQALREALAASMQTFLAEQRNAEMAISRSLSNGEKNIEGVDKILPNNSVAMASCEKMSFEYLPSSAKNLDKKKSEDTQKNVVRSYSSGNQFNFVARKGLVHSSSEEKIPKVRNVEESHKMSVSSYSFKRTSIVIEKDRTHSSSNHWNDTDEVHSSRKTPEYERTAGTNSRQDSQSPQWERYLSSDDDEEEDSFQDRNMPRRGSETQRTIDSTGQGYSGPATTKTVGHISYKAKDDVTREVAKSSGGNREVHGTESGTDDRQLEESAPSAMHATSRAPPTTVVDADMTPSVSTTVSNNHSVKNADVKTSLSRASGTSRSYDESMENTVDPSCFMMFAPVRSSGLQGSQDKEEETACPATAVPTSIDGQASASGGSVPVPQVPTSSIQEQYAAALSDLNHTLSSLKLQMQVYPLASIPPRLPLPYPLVPGTLPAAHPSSMSPEQYQALLSMYSLAQQTHDQGAFLAGSTGVDPRVQQAPPGMYGQVPTAHSPPAGSLSVGLPAMHSAAVPQTVPPQKFPQTMPPQQFPQTVPPQQFPQTVPPQKFPQTMPPQQFPQTVPPQQFPLPGMFLPPARYTVPPAGGPSLHGVVDPRLFQQPRSCPTSFFAPPRPHDANTVAFASPRLATPQGGMEHNVARHAPVTSPVQYDPPGLRLSQSRLDAGKEAFMFQQHSTTPFAQGQPFLHLPPGVNPMAEQQVSYPFVMQQPHVGNPGPVHFQPQAEADVGRGRGRLRH